MNTTLGIIKPDAVKRNLIGKIVTLAEESGLSVAAMKLVQLSKLQAQGFYHVHRDRPFFDSLTDFMSEGPILLMVFQGEDAISTWRRVMGATDPAQADKGTIRERFGLNIERNSVHGSDSPESAQFEIGYFFAGLEQV